MKLSILIAAIPERRKKLEQLTGHLIAQAIAVFGNNWPEYIEILTHETKTADQGGPSVGEKRNYLLSISEGDYVAFIDDDDWIEDNYLSEILTGIETKPDVVCFNVKYMSGGREQITHFSKNHVFNVNQPDPKLKLPHDHVRMPNHLMVVKREHALRAGFPEKNFGEDTAYGIRLRGPNVTSMLKTEYKIEQALYQYRFNPKTSRTHMYNPKAQPVADQDPILKMDVVIVSDGTKHRLLTEQAIRSIAGAHVNIIVLEKDAFLKYEQADTYLQRQPFNYNQCLNDGATMGNAKLICFSNNDVVFPEGFAGKVYEEMKQSKCDVLSVTNDRGFIHEEIISGFCFVMTRDAYTRISSLNEDYEFWCADNVTSEQIKESGLLERKSNIRVTHFTSETLKTLPPDTKEQYTRICVKRFNKRFSKNVLQMGT